MYVNSLIGSFGPHVVITPRSLLKIRIVGADWRVVSGLQGCLVVSSAHPSWLSALLNIQRAFSGALLLRSCAACRAMSLGRRSRLWAAQLKTKITVNRSKNYSTLDWVGPPVITSTLGKVDFISKCGSLAP